MALNKDTLKNSLTAALTLREDQPERSAADVAADLADAIEAYVKGGEVVGITTTVSVDVSTTGTANAQSGSGTGTGTQSGDPGRIQ